MAAPFQRIQINGAQGCARFDLVGDQYVATERWKDGRWVPVAAEAAPEKPADEPRTCPACNGAGVLT